MADDHNLSGPQFEQVRSALLDAYPAAQDLREMAQIQLGERLDAIAEGGNHAARVCISYPEGDFQCNPELYVCA